MNLNESNFNVHSIAASATTLSSASISFIPANVTTTATIVNGPNNATQRQPGRNSAFELPLWLILCYSVILLCAIVGNLLVISVLVQNRRMRTITNVFLLNLAISDILLGVLCMPVTLVGTLLRQFIFGEFFCKLIQFSQAASVAISSWTLVAISCERYYAICHPLSSRRWQTHSHVYKIIACIWLGSMLCMLPIAMFSQLMPTSRPGMLKCRENWPQYALPYERSYNLFLNLLLLVFPLLILSVAYILITRTLYVGMRMEKATIFGGKQENKHIPLHRKTFANNLLRKSSFYSAPSISANAASSSSSSLTSRYKLNLSMGGPDAITKTASFNNISSFATSNQLENHTKEVELPQNQQQRQHYKHQSQYQRLCQQNNFQNLKQPEHQIVFRDTHGHEHFQEQQQQPCCEPFLRLCCKSSLNSNTGRPHLYCMRFATLKTMLPDKEGNAMSNFCTADCCSGLGSSHTLNVNTNSHSNLTPTTITLSKSTSGLTTTSAATTMYRHQLQHQQQHIYPFHTTIAQTACQCMAKQQQMVPQSTDARKQFNKKSLKITASVLRRNNITKNWECKKRVIKMLFVLVLEFFICWTPLYVINTLAMYIGTGIYEYIDYTSISVLQLLAYSSSCCNPITYCFMNANFRRAFWDTFKNMPWCGKWFQRKHSTAQRGGNLCLAGSMRVNSCTIQTVIDSPRL